MQLLPEMVNTAWLSGKLPTTVNSECEGRHAERAGHPDDGVHLRYLLPIHMIEAPISMVCTSLQGSVLVLQTTSLSTTLSMQANA